MNVISRAENYLKQYGMHPDCVHFDDCKAAFIGDMMAGLEGASSSLAMIPTYLSQDRGAREGDTAIAIDIGGTNLRIALTRFCSSAFEILESIELPVPGLLHEITKYGFIHEIADQLRPFINKSSHIGVCFSHAAEILPNRDGRLLSFSKEIKVSGAVGMEITSELSKALVEYGHRAPTNYVLLNDTAAVLLAGAAYATKSYDGYIGFVLGTGMNLSCINETNQIKKLQGSYQKSMMIVNTEAGDFNRVPPGVLDVALNKTTSDPQSHLFEKMTSGRYLGQLILLTIQKAAADGLLSTETGAAVLALQDLPLPEISLFLADIHSRNALSDLCMTQDDRTVLFVLAEKLTDRAAKLTVMSVAAILEKTNTGSLPGKPVCVIAEGSTFHKLYSFKDKFSGYIKSFINEKQGRYCLVETIENATLLGTSFAALIN